MSWPWERVEDDLCAGFGMADIESASGTPRRIQDNAVCAATSVNRR